MANYFRYATDDGEEFDHAQSFESVFDADDAEWLASEAAEDYHDRRDGWEASWDNGKLFWLWAEDGTFIGKFTVFREYEPRFHATATPTNDASGEGEG